MRIGLIYPAADPTSPAAWSGTPRGLLDGLRLNDVEVVTVPARRPPMLGQAIALLSRSRGRRGHVAHSSPIQARARTRAMARALGRLGPLDAVVAMGTDMYDLAEVVPAGLPTATYDDGTFALFMRHPESDIRRYGFPKAEVDRWIERQKGACRTATACCVGTAWAARSVIDDYGVHPERVHVVGMGHRPRGRVVDRDWSVPRFLFVGVDWDRKNGQAVLDSFARLREAHPAATLDLVGEHPPVDAPGVIGHGFLRREDGDDQARLDSLFARATAFVLPSRFDPYGIAYLEAASAGVPVIATTEGGAAEVLGEAAVNVHPRDQDGITAALHRLAEPDRAAALGSKAARRAAGFTWAAVSRRILASLAPLPA